MPDATLLDLLARAAGSSLGVRFLDRDERGTVHTYAELMERAAHTGAALRELGVQPGDRVAIILPTSPEFYDAFFGAIHIGAVPVPLYPPVRLGQLEEYVSRTAELLRGCETRLVLADARTAGIIGRSVEAAEPPLGLRTVDALRRRGETDGATEAHAADPDEVAFIQHSSGTTGVPRPIALTHRAIRENVRAIRNRLLNAWPELDGRRHAAVSWLPLYHDMGLIGSVLTALAHPAELTLIPPELFVARPAIWLRAVSRYRGTISGAPNFAYALCTDRVCDEEMKGHDLSSWLVALNGAEPVTASALHRFADRFARFGFRAEALTPVYGLAEATLAVTFSDPARRFSEGTFDADALARDGVARPANGAGVTLVGVGRPLPGIELRIRDEAGVQADDGMLGRVLVRGPSVMVPDRPAGTWLDTGDTGFLRDGELFLYGRAKDVLILHGQKHAPQVVEHALDLLPGVRAGCVAALGVPGNDDRAESLVVLMERSRGEPASGDQELARSAHRRIVAQTGLVPDRVVILEPGTLPRTSSGKIRRLEARRRYVRDALSPPDRRSAFKLVREMMRSGLALVRLRRSMAR